MRAYLPVSSSTGISLPPSVMLAMYSALRVLCTGIIELSSRARSVFEAKEERT